MRARSLSAHMTPSTIHMYLYVCVTYKDMQRIYANLSIVGGVISDIFLLWFFFYLQIFYSEYII